MKRVFIDTNCLIHYKFPDEINWMELVGVNVLEVVIMPQIISEIDKHKYNDRSRIRKRASQVVKKLEEYLISSTEKKIVVLGKVIIDYESLSNEGFDEKNGDDVFLFSVLQYIKDKNIESDDAIVITNDLGLKLKCESRSVNYLSLPGKYEYQLEKNKHELENIRLQKELVNLKKRLPIIELIHKKDQEKFDLREIEKFPDYNKWINYQLSYIEDKVPYLREDGTPFNKINRKPNTTGYIFSQIFGLSKERINDYNKKVKDFYTKSLEVLKYNYKIYKITESSIKVDLCVRNIGSEPAENTDLIITCNKGAKMFHIDLIPSLKKLPIAPEIPENNLTLATITSNIPISSKHKFEPNIVRINERVVQIDERTIRINVGKVKHNMREDIGQIFLALDDQGTMSKIVLHGKFTCDNLRHPVESSIIMKIE